MELNVSDQAYEILGVNARVKEQIVGIVHAHLGLASIADVDLCDEPRGVKIETARGSILMDLDLKRRLDR